jgi:hypothetical protein
MSTLPTIEVIPSPRATLRKARRAAREEATRRAALLTERLGALLPTSGGPEGLLWNVCPTPRGSGAALRLYMLTVSMEGPVQALADARCTLMEHVPVVCFDPAKCGAEGKVRISAYIAADTVNP